MSKTELMLSHALNYVARFGWFVFPLCSIDTKTGKCSCKRPDCNSKNQGKHPRTQNGVLDASNDPDVIRKWWTKWPMANIALACGKSGLVVLDVDPRNGGEETLVELKKQHGDLPPTPMALTGGGGMHYLFAKNEPSQVVRGGSIPNGIDIKADGGYVVVTPSSHISGKQYIWDAGAHPEDIPIAPVPEWVLEFTKGQSDKKQSEIHPEDGYLGAAFRSAGWAGKDLGLGRIAVQCPWEAEHSCGSRFDGSTVVFAPNVGCNTGRFWCSHGHCGSKRTLKDVLKALPGNAHQAARKHLGLPDNHQVPSESEPSPDTGEPWEASLRVNSAGFITKAPGNAALLVSNLSDWRECIRYDEFTGKSHWTRPPPVLEGIAPPRVGDELQEHHIIYVQHWLERYRHVSFTSQIVAAAIESAAQLHKHNSAQDYITHLEWDRKPRIANWLTTYLGVEDTEYTRYVGRWWPISGIARVMSPGCQVDHMLVLKGPKGIRKTSAFITLAGPGWCLESMPRLGDKDAMGILRGKWVAVFNELESLRGAGITQIYDFLTRRIDSFRKPYGRYFFDVPRTCVFGGTTNEEFCLPLDATGTRRFWPVTVRYVNIDGLGEFRDQIWAEAYLCWRAGEQWYPQDVEIARLLEQTQSLSMDQDPWYPTVSAWLELRDDSPFTIMDCLFLALRFERSRISRADSTRLGIILKQLGYGPMRIRVGEGNRVRQYFKLEQSANEKTGGT
jgi:hypothetical protein